MKFRIHHLALLSLSALLIAAGCGNNNASNSSTTTNASGAAEATALPESSKLNIKVSFYPIYEFTKNVAGDLADVEALIPQQESNPMIGNRLHKIWQKSQMRIC